MTILIVICVVFEELKGKNDRHESIFISSIFCIISNILMFSLSRISYVNNVNTLSARGTFGQVLNVTFRLFCIIQTMQEYADALWHIRHILVVFRHMTVVPLARDNSAVS